MTVECDSVAFVQVPNQAGTAGEPGMRGLVGHVNGVMAKL
jgi:hypothetical protein